METHISVIFKIMDRFRKRPLLAPEVSISLNNQIRRPLYKSGGYFIFTDLAPGETCFEFVSPAFQKEIVTADIPEAGKGYVIRHLLLNPSTAYPFGGTVTTVAGRIMNNKLPLSNQQFYIIPGKGGEVMKVAEDKAEAGNKFLRLFAAVPERQLSFPVRYLIKDKDEARREVCLITEGSTKDGMYSLEKGMIFSHLRATPLVEVIECMTSGDGSFFFALPELKSGRVSLDFLIKAKDGKSIKKTLEIEGNQRNILTPLEIK